jgi:hypothetical protein
MLAFGLQFALNLPFHLIHVRRLRGVVVVV